MMRKTIVLWLLVDAACRVAAHSEYFTGATSDQFDLGTLDVVFHPTADHTSYTMCVYPQAGSWNRFSYSSSAGDNNHDQWSSTNPTSWSYSMDSIGDFPYLGTSYSKIYVTNTGYLDLGTQQTVLTDGSFSNSDSNTFLKKPRIAGLLSYLTSLSYYNQASTCAWYEKSRDSIVISNENYCVGSNNYGTYCWSGIYANFQMELRSTGAIAFYYSSSMKSIAQGARVGLSYGGATSDVSIDISALANTPALTFTFGPRTTDTLDVSFEAAPYAESYVVDCWCQSSSTNRQVWTTTTSETSVSVTGLTPGTDYFFTVQISCLKYDDSRYVASTMATSPVRRTLPSVVESITATTTSNSITFTWQAASGATGYKYTIDNGPANTTTASTVTLSGLESLTNYTIRVYSGVVPDYSSDFTEYTAFTRPSPVTNIVQTAADSTLLTASWESENGNLFDIYLKEGTFTVFSAISTTTCYTVTGLSPNTNYTLTVYAGTTESGFENVGNCAAVDTLPNPPTGLTLLSREGTSLTFEWSANGAETYHVKLSPSGHTGVANTNSYQFTGLQLYTTYIVSVSSARGKFVTSECSQASGVTYGANATNIVVTGRTSNSLSFSWSAPPGVVDYQVQLSGGNVYSTSTSSYTFSPLTGDTGYVLTISSGFEEGPTYQTYGAVSSLERTLVDPTTYITRTEVDTTCMSFSWPIPAGATAFNVKLDGNGQIQTAALQNSENTVSFSGLKGNTQYAFTVFSGNDDGYEQVGLCNQFTTLPEAVASVTVIVQPEQLTVSWDSSAGAKCYDVSIVEVTTSSGVEVMIPVDDVVVTGLSYVFDNLTANTLYTIEVRAGNADGMQSVGTSISQATSLSAVSNLVCNNATNNSIWFEWSAATGSSATYNLQLQTSSGAFVSEKNTTLTHIEFDDLTAGSTYNLIATINSTSGFPVTATCKTLPSAPGYVTISAVTCDSIVITWGQSQGANVYLLTLTADAQTPKTVTTSSLSIAISDLDSGTQYHLLIQAGVSNKFEPDGRSTSVETLPAKPTNLALAERLSDGLTFSWTTVTSATFYVVSLWQGGKRLQIRTVTTPAISFTGLDPNAIYVVDVLSGSSAGNNTLAATMTASTYPSPSVEVFLANSCPLSISIAACVSWDAVTGADEYQLNWTATASGDCFGPVTVIRDTTYTLVNLLPNTEYELVVYSGASGLGFEAVGSSLTFTTRPAIVPSLTCSAATTDSFTLSWPSVDGATEYHVGLVDDFAYTVMTNQFTFDSLDSPGTAYSVIVSAGNNDDYENIGKTGSCFTMPNTLTGLKITESTEESLSFLWTPSNGASAYLAELYFYGNSSLADTVSLGSVNSVQFRELASNTRYVMHLFAGIAGVGFSTDYVSIDSTSVWTTPLAPENLHVVSYTSTSISVEWDASAGATGYEAALYEEEVLVKTVGLEAVTNTTFASLVPFTNYTVIIEAQNDGGTGPTGTTVLQRTRPGVVKDLDATAGDTFIYASWIAPVGAQAYRAELLSSSGDVVGTPLDGPDVSCNFSSLATDTFYYVRVYSGVSLGELDSLYCEISLYTLAAPLCSAEVESATSSSIVFQFEHTAGLTGVLVNFLDDDGNVVNSELVTNITSGSGRRSSSLDSFSIGELSVDTPYKMNLLTISQGGIGTRGPTISYSTFPLPVTGFAGLGSFTSANFTWIAAEGAASYMISQFDKAGTALVSQIGNITGTAFSYPCLDPGIEFKFEIFVCLDQVPACSSEGTSQIVSTNSIICSETHDGDATFVATTSGNNQTGICDAGFVGSPIRECMEDIRNWGPIIDSCIQLPEPLGNGSVRAAPTYDTVVLSWETPARATLYKIYQKRLSDYFPEFEISNNGSAVDIRGNSYTVRGLDQRTDYCFEIYTGNAGGYESLGSYVSATTYLEPPLDVHVANLAGTSFDVVWTPPGGAQFYQISIKGGKYATLTELTLVNPVVGKNPGNTETQYSITSLDVATAYMVIVFSGVNDEDGSASSYCIEPIGSAVNVTTLGEKSNATSSNLSSMSFNLPSLVIAIVAYAVTLTVYAAGRFRYPHARNALTLVFGFTLIDVGFHVAFLASLPLSSNVFIICLLFLVVTFVLNLGSSVFVLLKEVNENRKGLSHFERQPVETGVVVLFSIFNVEILDTMASGIFDWQFLSYNFCYASQLRIVFLSPISNIVQDIPILCLLVYWIISAHSGSLSSFMFVALAVTAISLVFGLSRRVYLIRRWRTVGVKHQDLYPASDAVFDILGGNTIFSMDQVSSNKLVYSEPTLLFTGGGGMVFSDPSQIWSLTPTPNKERPDLPYVYIIHPDQSTATEVCVSNGPLVLGSRAGENAIGFPNSTMLPSHCEIQWSQQSPLVFRLVSYSEFAEGTTLLNGRALAPLTPAPLQENDVVQMGVASPANPGATPVVFSIRFVATVKSGYQCACLAIQSAGFTPVGPVASSGGKEDSGMSNQNRYSMAPSSATPSRPSYVVLRASNFPQGSTVVDISRAPLLIGSGSGVDTSQNILRVGMPGLAPVQLKVFSTGTDEKSSFRASDPSGRTVIDGQTLPNGEISVALTPGSAIALANDLFVQVTQISMSGTEPFVEMLFPDASILDVNNCHQVRA